jgi:hypothetical protein
METSGGKTRDIVLLVVLGLLVVIGLMPEKKSSSRDRSDPAGQDASGATGRRADDDSTDLIEKAHSAVANTNKHYTELERELNRPEMLGGKLAEDAAREAATANKIFNKVLPATDVPHLYFPLISGSKWVYTVTGHRDLVVSRKKWTMKVIAAPEVGRAGTLKVGFDDSFKLIRVMLKKDGAINIDSLPFIEPLGYLGNKPIKITGEFLPNKVKIVKGSVWRNEYKREVMHDFYDESNRLHRVPAIVMQTERAQGAQLEQIPSPSGMFDTRRIGWVSRLSIKVKGRPVISNLTSKPYRRESMWVARGYGIIRRKVEYLTGRKNKEVVFDLVDYSRPEKKQKP